MGSKIVNNSNRIKLIDPNNFDNQFNLNTGKEYNMSVPIEDLSIIVELKTTSKSRTILRTNDLQMQKNNKKGGTITFIDGMTDKTTGNENYLTTKYTDLGTQLDEIDEALGITSIDIDFNSSYAPMVNINFIDVKGGALFQSGGKSKYDVLFSLPYPIFELKIKGFYGKPVTYCLHMLKCNIKFNSQTGNFEIAAQFVGYTYAMLSDMLIGYLKAAVETKDGAELLAKRNMISINKFIREMGDIDKLIKAQLDTNNANTNELAIVKELKELLLQMQNNIKSTIGTLSTSYQLEGESKNSNIVIVHKPGDSDTFEDYKNFRETVPNFVKMFNAMVIEFNNKSGNDAELKIKERQYPVQTIANVSEIFAKDNTAQIFTLHVKYRYNEVLNTNDEGVLNSIVNRLKDSIPSSVSVNNKIIKFYDFTDISDVLNTMSKLLATKEEASAKKVYEDLKNSISSKLQFEPNIRNIIGLLTTHIEVFLKLLFDVSAKYKDTARLAELSSFQTTPNSNLTSIDVNDENKKTGLIYPWPEYFKNNVEEYLGSPKGPLKNPLNVPEIKFVEEFYEAMVKVSQNEQEITTDGIKSWFALNPIDSLYYLETSPYDRLDGSSKPEDIARLATLRAIGFLSFSNSLLSPSEIETFASSEANAILKKYKDAKFILQGLKTSYDSPDKFANVTGTINGIPNTRVLTSVDNDWKYTYIYPNDNLKQLLPIDKGFTNVSYNLLDETASEYKLSSLITNHSSSLYDTSKYIDFIDSATYESKSVASPRTEAASVFSYIKLKTNNKAGLNSGSMADAGFLTNNGKYGVQEFNNIDYTGSDYGVEKLPFYSLFYDNSGASPFLVNGRKAVTKYDINNKIKTIPSFFVIKFDSEQQTKNTIINNYDNIGKNLILFNKKDEAKIPFLNFDIFKKSSNIKVHNHSLFTTRFYNAQSQMGKAFLFLHSFPWRGLIGTENLGVFNQSEIINIFQYRTGFIQVPILFPAFIGGLLWRYTISESDVDKVIDVNDLNNVVLGVDPIIFKIGSSELLSLYVKTPKPNQYLKTSAVESQMNFSDNNAHQYVDLESVLINLPTPIKRKFIKEFINFATNITNGYPEISKLFEISLKTTITTPNVPPIIPRPFDIIPRVENLNSDINWVNTAKDINNNTIPLKNEITLKLDVINKYLNTADGVPFTDRYIIFSSIFSDEGVIEYSNYFTEFKEGSAAELKLKELFFGYKYISNDSWMAWNMEYKTIHNSNSWVSVSKEKFTIYINKLNEIIKTQVETDEKKVFSNNNNDQIKLEIYRTLKKIYDKWLGNVDSSGDILFQCCKINSLTDKENGGRLPKDTEYMNLRKKNTTNTDETDNTPKLIDSFRFLNRSFKDIGNIFQVNPVTVTKMLLESSNSSFYDVAGRILDDNHFDFIALPNFIDYNKQEELESVFEAYPYYTNEAQASSGPSFVCMYVGQTSTKLDFGEDSEYPDDGFNFTVDGENQPIDFQESAENHEDSGAAFIVRYGQQNQNIFKDIVIDQAEFNETAESLQITDQLANSFSQTNQTFVGQNLYNIYSIRSYKVEVEMMGDAMIQPMMYFQLDNIPMFRGAYLITKVKHSIKPNYMTTNFTGTRINRNQTPFVDTATLFSSMLEGYTIPKAATGAVLNTEASNSYVTDYYNILKNNKPNETIINGSTLISYNITSTSSAELVKFNNGKKKEKEMTSDINYFFTSTKTGEYTGQPWSAAFISFVMRSADKTFPASASHYYYVKDAMDGKNGYEAFPLSFGLKIKAEIGDILIKSRTGDYQSSHGDVIYKIEGNLAYLVGGNVSDSVLQFTINLENGYIVDSSNVKNAKILLKKTNNKYYHGKQLSKMLSKSPTQSVKFVNGSYTGYKSQKVSPSDTIKSVYIPAQNQALPNISKGMKLLMQAQAQLEGFYPTSKSYKNNNPGNVGTYGGNVVTKFPTLVEGLKAQWNQVLGLALVNKSKYYKSTNTLFEYLSIYAPPTDNNDPTAYTNFVINYFKSNGVNISSTTTLSDINNIV